MKNETPQFTPLAGTGVKPLIIAGPCSAETEEQTLATAREISALGVKVFRAGVWKPRTKPGNFEGIGTPALLWLRKVKEQTGMLTATEVATPVHVRHALKAGVDILWIGARTTANPFAVDEIAAALRGVENVGVLVKNPLNPDIEAWIGAFERLLRAGITRLGGVHRGFSGYGKHLYRNMPEWSVPIELRRRMPGLPVIVDPSHICGRADLVAPMSREAMAMGFDGLMVETHITPSCAWSDREQQLTPAQLGELLQSLEIRAGSVGGDSLASMRQTIDAIDDQLIDLLARRMAVSEEIGRFKNSRSMPVLQPERYDALMGRRVEEATHAGLPPRFMRRLFSLIHEESVRRQLPPDEAASRE